MAVQPQLTFHGAAGTVTGSKYLLEVDGARLLVDCGMFQGERPLRERNWQRLPFDPDTIDAVLLTHAHLDHSGMLPVLHRSGYRGPIYCTRSTAALAQILLTDAGRIQEEDARHANRHGYSRHHPAQPLFTEEEALQSLELLSPIEFDTAFEPRPGIGVRFRPAGHILGAAWLEVDIAHRRLVFSGDLGRPADPIMRPPAPLERCDWLVVESTYGDRRHDAQPPELQLLDVIERTRRRGGMVLIPAFAVGRAQAVLHLLWHLKSDGRLGRLPIFLDSPMAIEATELFRANPRDHRLTPEDARAMCGVAHYVRTTEESRALNDLGGPMIVISASGMMSGGRVLHHVRNRGGDPRNTILFTGYQAAGTRGADILAGAATVKIHGYDYPIRAEVVEITTLSAHADSREILDWVRTGVAGTRRVFVTHGEPHASRALKTELESEINAQVQVPMLGETCALS